MTPWNWLKRRFKPQRVRTPTLLQMEVVECGAAALGIVLAYYGRIAPLAELRQACGVSRDGSKASNMVKAARLYGLDAKGFRKNLDSLRTLPLPFIVFWHFNHFLVVEGWGKNRVFLNDPATGPRSVSWAEFDEGFTGVVLLMQPGTDFQRGGQKPSLARALWDRLKGSIPAWVYTLLLGALLVIPGLVIPVFSQVFVDRILIGGQTDWLRPLVVGMVGIVLLQGVLRSLQLGYLRQLKLKLAAGMNGRFIWHILRLPIGFYAQRYAGEISARVTLNDQVANLLSGQLGTTLIDLVMVLFYAAVMFTYDPMLTWIGIGAALINVIVLQWVGRQRVDANLRLSQDLGKLSGVEISGIQSIETLKASASESDFFARWAGYYAKYLNAQQALDRTNQTIGILPPLLSSLTAMLILVFGGLRVIEGHLSIGMLVAFQGLMTSFQLPIRTLVNFGQELQNLESDLYRLDDVLQNPIDEALHAAPALSDHAATTRDTPQLRGDVEFCNATFGYSRVEAPLIESFNLRIKPGQRVALVGSSGSGKSTVAKLACGLYQLWSGELTFDGQRRAEIPALVLAQSLAMVEQDIFLFGGTVRDNLTLWDDTVPDADLIRACRDAEIHETILALPGGYDSMLLEGAANLSGGQRQRLEIARALINNPAILVLDEATSALDAETEQRIDRNLRRRGCTCLLIAHRLSTIRDCDWILVLERGQVVEQGTHDQLWAADGPYARLIQSEGEALRTTESDALSVGLDQRVDDAPPHVPPAVAVAKRGDLAPLFATLTPPIQLQPYERFALSPVPDSPSHPIGWVTSGPVAITALPPASQYPSRQHHLFDLEPHTVLFRLPPVAGPAWTVVAIALGSASLQPLATEPWDQAVQNGALAPLKALQQWCQQLQDSLQPLEMRPSLPQWSQATSASEALEQFHRQVLAALADWADQHRQAIWQQLNRKAALNQSATTRAVRQLAAAINPTQGTVVPQGSPLLVAAGAVGHAMQIGIQPIRASENLDQQMDPILAIARASQVRVRRVLLSDTWWQQDAGPLLGHLREDHTPVAILPKPSGTYEVLHPQTQQRIPLTRKAAYQLEAIAYTFYRSFPATRDRLGSLFSFALEGQGKTLLLTFLAGMAVTLLGMLTPQATGLLMDYAIPNADKSAVLQMGLGLGTAALASALFQLVQNFATLRLEAIADARSQAALWDHLLKLKLAFFRQYSTGDLQSRVSAIRHIRQILSGSTLRTLISSFIAFLNLGLLWVYNASLASIALVITLVVMVLTFAASALSRRYLRRLQELQGASFGFMVQLIGGIAKLRVATAETRAFARWASRYTELLTLFRYSQRIEDGILLANALVPTLSNAIIFSVAVGLLQAPATPGGPPAFSSGSFLAFHAAFGLLLAGATDLSNTLVHALDVSILWERSQPILRAVPEVDENTTDPGRLSGSIVLDHVAFRYRDDGAMVLSDICLEANPGDFIAIVGPSGSGKSTLMRLLLGFDQPTSGRIFYDGQDLAGLDVGAVRRQLGVVLQNGKINAASLYENIAGAALVTLDEAMAAARMAGLAEDIAAMPMGMHTVISEGGSNLSGGQRQRLLIARALALNPKILFFDEATSALDNRTQDIVTQSLDRLHVTRIVIAHRLSTIRTADRICVLSGGRMVQSGTYEQLAQEPGLFAQLMARQTL